MVITFYITCKCNIKCVYCYEPKSNLVPDLSICDIDYYIQKLTVEYNNIYSFVLFGGEPVLRWDLVSYAIRRIRLNKCIKNKKIVLFTNGLLLNENKLLFLKANSVDLYLSFDGYGVASLPRFGKNIDSYINSINNVFRICEESDNGVTIVITLGSHNIENVADDILVLFKEYMFKNYKFNIIKNNRFKADKHKIIRLMDVLKTIKSKYGLVFFIDHPDVFGSIYDNVFISSKNIRYLPAKQPSIWEYVGW